VSQLNARLDLPLGVVAPTAARRAMRSVLMGWGYRDPDWLDEAELIVSELVSNAVRHGGGCIELSMQSHDHQVVTRAADGSSVVPRRRYHLGPDAGGLGLKIIEAYGAGWGAEDYQGGKRVWVRLRPYPGASSQDH
jgi:anti-sigma regulatory factor (Ser/Thr protein kinase)